MHILSGNPTCLLNDMHSIWDLVAVLHLNAYTYIKDVIVSMRCIVDLYLNSRINVATETVLIMHLNTSK